MKRLIYFLLILTFLGCNTTIPLDKNFFETSKVGVIILADKMEFYRAGSQGLLDRAFTPASGYKDAVAYSENKIFDFSTMINDSLSDIFDKKQKKYLLIKDKFKKNTFPKFKSSEDYEYYYKSDIRGLKDSLGIDELMIIKINYGMEVAYYAFVETGKTATSKINVKIVKTSNNIISFDSDFKSNSNFESNWEKDPEYKSFIKTFDSNIKSTISKMLQTFSQKDK